MNQPVFVVVGAVNHGKSSVVSALAENDQVRISAIPGETTACRRFWLRDLFAFYDTPGFQNAIAALRELEPAARAGEPLSVFREFLSRRRGDADFEAECRLLKPVVEEDAGILYVVDGSAPLREFHEAEMEILRLTGQPRLAVINRTRQDDHLAEWKRRLALHFNAVREFDAHRARFPDRIELLETLAGIEQQWKARLMEAVSVFREEWTRRLEDCAETIAGLLQDALTHVETAAGSELNLRREAISGELRRRFVQAQSRREARAHQEIVRIFEHHRITVETLDEPFFDSDLFSEETWRLFGLDSRQLLVAGVMTGAAGGVVLDLATAGHSIGLPTVLGGIGGGVASLLVGRKRPELKARLPSALTWLPGRQVQFGGRTISVGPCRALNFPWILLDRAVGACCYTINRSHARRDEAVLRAPEVRAVLEKHGAGSAQWDEDTRRVFTGHFAALRRGRFDAEERAGLRQALFARLEELGRIPMDF